jgi:aspartyl-tRNA(Asn)/glutamyl-tRNA(Gln) amidotransferase subunit B
VTPEQVAEVVGLVGAGTLNGKLAREVFAGELAGEGSVADGRRSRAGARQRRQHAVGGDP